MAGKKDYFGIAISGFNSSVRFNKETREPSSLSLYEQLKKNGTAAEKMAIRKMEIEKAKKERENPSRKQYDSKELNPYS